VRSLKIGGMFTVVAAVMAHAMLMRAESPEPPSAAAIRQVLGDQVAAWNRGDVDTFMHAYKDSPDTTFIGKSVEHGYVPILERYKKAYASKDSMGTLDFAELAVRELGANYAVVIGKFHLARNAAGGGDVSGIFSLVWEKTAAGWKIILDHSSVTTP
jgi:uncharacterized protein (TIGR02246 family)